jgi:hypothetical protein
LTLVDAAPIVIAVDATELGMETETAPSLADHRTITLEGMRAEMAAQGARKGPAGVLAKAILRLLEALVALLAEFKAGRLAGAAPGGAGSATAPDYAAAPVDGARLPAPRSDWSASWPNPTADAGEGEEPPNQPRAIPQTESEICDGRSGDASAGRNGCVARRHPSPSGCAGPPSASRGEGTIPGLRRGPRSRPAAPSRLQDWRANRGPIQKTGFGTRGLRAIILLRYRNF